MDFNLIPSLEHMALVAITASLWNQDNIIDLMNWFPVVSNDKFKKWKEIEDLVTENVSHLMSLPNNLRIYVLCSIKPMGVQILRWLESHKNLYFGILRTPKFFWTMQGLLDTIKTAEALIQDDNLYIVTRYKIACTYCLDTVISELWNELSENLKKIFNNREYSRRSYHNRFSLDPFECVVSLWTYDIQRELLAYHNIIEGTPLYFSMSGFETRIEPYQYAFEFSASVGNKAATEYFLQKLTPREKEVSLTRFIKYGANGRPSTNILERYSNVLFLLISEMDEEHQLQVYERSPCMMLECLLDWPWQTMFIEFADRVWNFLPVKDYADLLNKIVLKVNDGFQDWDYRQLFGQFWKKGSSTHKRFVLDENIWGPLLTNLCKIKDMSNLALLVLDATVSEKEEIVYYRTDVIKVLINNGEWSLLRLLVDCLSSEDIVGKFQKQFLERDLTSFTKKDMVEKRVMLKQFLKSLIKLISRPRYAQYASRNWTKESKRLRVWNRLKIQRYPIERLSK